MKTRFFIALALGFIALSCTKEADDLTVTLKNSGTLSVKLVDNEGGTISDTKIRLYESTAESYSYNIDELYTDNNGFVNFGEVTSGTYILIADTPKVNDIKYMPVKIVQVLTGSDKQVTINVEEYVGTANLKFVEYVDYNYVGYSNLNVILVPYEKVNYYDSLETFIGAAEYTGVTDSEGKLSFTIPSSRVYYLIVYDENKNYDKLNYISVSKGEIVSDTYSVYFSSK
jgi:hypothetical protein